MNRRSARRPIGAVAILGSRLVGLALILLMASPTPFAERVTRWIGAGDRAVERGQFDQARAQYTRALNALPAGSAVAYDRLVSVSLASQDYALAQVYLHAAAALEGWTPSRNAQLRSILDHGKPSELLSALVYASMKLQNSDDPRLLRQIAQQQIDHLAWDQLEVTLRQWMALEPANGNALYWWGLYLAPEDPIAASEVLTRAAADGEWGERAEYARDALAGYGALPLTEAHTRLGVTLAGLHEWAFAERTLTLAVEANALNPTALAYLGLARDQQGRDGLPSIQAALALSPNDPVLHYLAGLHWRQAGDDRAAVDAFSQAYWLDPANPAPAVEVAVTLQRLGDIDEAARWYELAVSVAPDNLQWVGCWLLSTPIRAMRWMGWASPLSRKQPRNPPRMSIFKSAWGGHIIKCNATIVPARCWAPP